MRANEHQKQELLQIAKKSTLEFLFYHIEVVIADLYIDCLFEEEEPVFDSIIEQPVLVGCLLKTNQQLPSNYIRINTWFGSLNKSIWELACSNEVLKPTITNFCEALSIKAIYVYDSVGLIVAPSVCMIINEAFFALQDGISSKQDIDIAMKLGTNYPFGPFEWGEKIGLKKVYSLLKALEQKEEKYKPCDSLIKEALA